VFATKAFDTDGIAEQLAVEAALGDLGIQLELVGSYYAVEPGTVRKDDQSPVRVYTPFYRRWSEQSIEPPYSLDVKSVNWLSPTAASAVPSPTSAAPYQVIAGEEFALSTLQRFLKDRVFSYSEDRNRPDKNGTSKLSHALAHGEIHPRTLLNGLGAAPGQEVFRKEIAWREFYADVLFHNPRTVTDYYEPRFANMRYDSPVEFSEKLLAWKTGQTGYPIVDAAMRQLVQTGWMHNRTRMIVASFLVKDLHFEWQLGAQFFEEHLTDFDPASNAHGWQWTAGCGTDASPYYRVFNPVLQGIKFDPNGHYVKRWVPELSHLDKTSIHEPWNDISGYQHGYPPPIVDHGQERLEALARLEELKG
jgi:deoxyribodipyrimidine photo-lyase